MEHTETLQSGRIDGHARIGILGGSFDPIHNGHLNIARHAYEQFALDEVWFLPAWIQPLKQGRQAAPAEHRRRMTELAIARIPFFSICDYELEKKGISYTYQTLEALKRQRPEAEFFFILGADSISTFEQWVHPERICACAALLAASRHQNREPGQLLREQAERLRERFGARIFFLDTPYYDISSTRLRSLKADELLRSEELPPQVAGYIREHQLYRTDSEGGI